MLRFLFLARVSDDVRSREAHRDLAARVTTRLRGWRCVLDQPGLKAYCGGQVSNASRVHVLADGAGVIFGTLFATDGATRGQAILDPDSSQRIAATAGRDLVDHYWGRYVAVLPHADSLTTRVVRDPTGGLSCFLASARGIHVGFSCVEDYLALGIASCSINWKYISARLTLPLLECRATALTELSEVLGGECVRLDRHGLGCAFYWDPVRIAENMLEDANASRLALRETALGCVQAWSTCYRRIAHRLSGGLDSSIVAGLLAQTDASSEVTCVNYFMPGTDSDERAYARLTTQRSGHALIEVPVDGAQASLEPLRHLQRTARPYDYFGFVSRLEIDRALRQRIGADAVFDGGGGDQLFYAGRPALAAADYVFHRGVVAGWNRELWRIALQAAHRERRTVWSVLRLALRERRQLHRWHPIAERRGGALIVTGAERDPGLDRFLHPWVDASRDLPSGKRWHLHALSFSCPFHTPFAGDGDPEPVHPLVSQPLIELALRIPTWILAAGGVDRALARSSFAFCLAPEIIARRAKGGAQQFARAAFQANLPLLREFLLDGLLLRAGLLDRAALGRALAGRHPAASPATVPELFDLLSVEAWVRSWVDLPARAAA